ncbi:MAG: amidophosphoribosyltransferase [Deltaproteobacteria bacterium RBG_19FT_COMBO_46_12]|nr:MAG: amidophosphoribosyltransferase [Deltaproteobacteria bacterium RBG_19FT_COMBO_46_12]
MCGIFGIYNHPEASNLAYLGLYALQHRGQESAGIVSSDHRQLHHYRQMGLVSEVFTKEILKKLSGRSAIGHVRYSTAGSSELKNAQPFVVDYHRGSLAIAHNGNLTNASFIKSELESRGSIFQSNMDTEVIVHLIARFKEKTIVERTVHALKQVEGAYSLLILTEKEMIVARDPFGFRPLALGQLKEATVVASETCAFDLIGAKFVREIEPGEIILVNEGGIQSFRPFFQKQRRQCIFEFIYFARPDSFLFNRNVYEVRKSFGAQLAKESSVDADMVVPIPDSGFPAALGYAAQSEIPFELGMIRNHYIGRTFIEPEQRIRHFGVKIKLNPIKGLLEGKRIVTVDDSIVRATTSRKINKMFRNADVKEVHVRISSPPITHPCFFGIDTPKRSELIASSHNLKEIRKFINATSLYYLSLEGLKKCVREDADSFCYACFSGDYPIPFQMNLE